MGMELSRRGSIPQAMAWMFGLSAGLFWWPVLGGLIAGFVGGRKAGDPGRALAAAIPTAALAFISMFLLGGFFSLIPIIGPIFGSISGAVLGTVHAIPLVIGALIGGYAANK
jgi:hypothetical protein